MNSEKTIKNSIISVLAQILTLILQFINRRVFVIFLDIEFLGYQSLFGNIFTLLSVAELGIGNIISFHLYKEIVDKNEEEIGKLMYLYKWIYRIIAIVVLISGFACCLLVPYIVSDSSSSIQYLYLVYFIQLGSTVLGYFLSYKRTIYIANQKEYQCVKIDLYTTIIVQIIQLSILAIFRSYILYLIIQLSTTLIANIIISLKSNKDYPYLKKKYTITKKDIQRRNFISDAKNFLVHKISYAIYGGTDNVIISAICGIRDVALYGNYVLLQKGVMQVLFYKLLNPIQATLGNIVYSNRKKEDLWKQFQALDVFSFFFASYVGIGFLILFQPAIQLWMGAEYLLSYKFVIVFSITIYFGAVWEIVNKYRTVFGEYAKDRNCMILSAILNIVVSIWGAKNYGIVGVQIGTLIGFMPIAYGRIRFVIKYFFYESVYKYIFKHILLFGIVACEGTLCYFISYKIPISIIGILIRLLIWAVIPLVVNIIVCRRNIYFKEMLSYMSRMFYIVKEKIKR